MSANHTPGPWACHSGMVWKDGPTVYPKGPDDGIPIARMDREYGNGTVPTERDANAHLIAAAPALLDALKVLTLDDRLANIIGAVDPMALEQIQEAIKAAEGDPR